MPPVSPRPLLVKPPSGTSPQPSPPPTSPRAPPTLSVPSAPRPAARTTPTGPVSKLSVSRNYVIPPRPKPGRKPSQEVPPSRRKAQNREAQRAFRERKSQVVRALEDQLAQQAQEFARQQQQMKEQIAALQRQTTGQPIPPSLTSNDSSSPGSPSHTSNDSKYSPSSPGYSAGNSPNYSAAGSPNYPAVGSPNYSSNDPNSPASPASPNYSRAIPMQPQFAPAAMAMQAQFAPSPPAGFYAQSPPGFFATSPSCYLATSPHTPIHYKGPTTPADVVGLELLDHVLEQKLPSVPPSPSPHSPSPPTPLSKRRPSRSTLRTELPRSPGVVRTDPPFAANPLDLVNTDWHQPAVPLRRRSSSLETDFTMAFAPASPQRPKPFVFTPPPARVRDRCGFCTDNTPCVCAEAAARERDADQATDLLTLGSPISSPLGPSLNSLPLAGEPLGSPLKHSEEAKRPAESSGGCTGNPANCMQCQQDPMLTLFCSAVASRPPAAKLPALGTYIPAQAAYKTLSRHPGFASADLGELVNALLVKSSQIEVNSVAKVLRMLDQVRSA